ncbi:hypothetical protein TCDM_01681 [Trypanosoma cruzi Dm28c]|uniref:Uncharacterized protein n=1 Tax=Trypanosoma cruzi Dm28c TaxID=1416333 RepID=V5DQI2_TRYCR|nr:hypothetical protein TCDM_01681 [Trypanosoma cruzi Dm28c]
MRGSEGVGGNVNVWLLRYGHHLPLAALLVCIVLAATVNIALEIRYENMSKDKNAANATTTTTTTTSTTSTTTTTTTTSTTRAPFF